MKSILLAVIATITQCHIISGTIDRKTSPIDFRNLKISLNNGEYSGLVNNDGAFTIMVPDYAASYKLQVTDLHYYFEPVVVEISDSAHSEGKFIKAFLYSLKDGKDYRLMYPLQLEPSSRINYFEDRVPFDPTTYLKNPFVWMIGLTLVMS